jgi:Putative motility protein
LKTTQVTGEPSEHKFVDVSAITSLATQMSQQRTSQAVDLAILKKAMNLQASAAMTLIASVTPSTSLPSHLGQNVNIVA